MRQRTKFAIALVALALVLSGVVYGALFLFQDEARQQAKSQLQQTANVVANQTVNSLTESREVMRAFTSRPRSADYTRSATTLSTFTNNSEYETAAMIDSNWTIVDVQGNVTESARQQAIGSNGSTPHVREAYRFGGVVYSDPIQAPNSGQYFIEVAAANYDADGAVTGVVVARLDMDSFLSATSTLETDFRTVRITSSTGEGTVELKPANQSFDQSLNASKAVTNGDLSWTVHVVEDRGDLTARLDRLTLLQTGSLGVVFLAVLGLGYWEYNTNLKQTERLLEGFTKLREGDYEYTIDLSSATEWQRISEGYNELTYGLAEREREIREREQQLEVLNRVLRHNLQNDMNVIIGHAEMLPQFSDDDRVEDAAETIVRMGEGLVSHGQKARHLETVMGGDDEIVTVDAAEITATVLDRYRQNYPDVDFELDGSESARVAVSDTFEYAIENVVENAAAHNDADAPTVSVEISASDDHVEVAVADNGPGIPEHEYEVLQEGAETALQHGSGVGLWLAHWIVSRSNGTISFADRSPRGSIVTISVPAATADPA